MIIIIIIVIIIIMVPRGVMVKVPVALLCSLSD